DPHFGSEQAFSLVELLIVTLTLLIFTIAAVVQINRTIEHYDLTRLTSELIGKIETVRAECVKQSDGYPAATLLITSTTSPNRYALQFYYRTTGIAQPVHTDYTFDLPRNYQFQVTPGTIIYTFNPRGKALAYGSAVYDTATAPLVNLPVI